MKKILNTLLFLVLVFHPSSALSFPQDTAPNQNFNKCLHGYFGCDLSGLNNSERSQVEQASHLRNVNNCLHGYVGCDSSKLSNDEQPRVQEAARQRNFNNCLHGYVGCDSSKLSNDEQPRVQEAAHQRNLNNCLHGYVGCERSTLSDDEKNKLPSDKSSASHEQQQAAIPQSTPRYYTNKDGVRVQSPTRYSSQPPAATAQCLDGTYSFSLNRRGTCSYHGGVSKWIDRSPAAGDTRHARQSFRRFACTSDCSGHEAGFRWAEEHDITDADDCDAAGEHSNSPSFAEGCQAYVEGETAMDDRQLPDEDDNEDN